jgi:PilZ domain
MEPPVDRRAARRGRLRRGCRARWWPGPPGTGQDLPLELVDLSAVGAGFIVRESLDAGREVSLYFRAPAAVRSTVRGGMVVWCLPLAGGAVRVGLQFHTPLSKRELVAFCSTRR